MRNEPDYPTLPTVNDAVGEVRPIPRITSEVIVALAELEIVGRFAPNDVVEAARDEDSPLHAFFEWDDSLAAEAHRVEQARRLIRSVRVEIVTSESVIATPRYVRDPAAEEEQGYVTSEQLRTEPENARACVIYELKRAQAFVERARNIASALGFEKEFAKLSRSLTGVRQKIEGVGA